MNSVIFFFLSLFAAMSGTDPCSDPHVAEAYAEECADAETTPMMRPEASCVTDISNGF